MEKKTEVEMKVSQIRKALEGYEGFRLSSHMMEFENFVVFFIYPPYPIKNYVKVSVHANKIITYLYDLSTHKALKVPHRDRIVQEQVEQSVTCIANFLELKKKADI